jgi:hypothetical protein
MGISGWVFEQGSICVGRNGSRVLRVGTGRGFFICGLGRAGRTVEQIDLTLAASRCDSAADRRRRQSPSPPHLPSSDVDGRIEVLLFHLVHLRIRFSSSTAHSLPLLARCVGEVL